MPLYKTSDNNEKPNVSVLMKLMNQYGEDSEEVQAYIDRFRDDASFMSKVASLMSDNSEGDTNDNVSGYAH